MTAIGRSTAVALLAVLAACSSNKSGTSGPQCSAVANAGPDQTVPYNTVVLLDGSMSYSTAGVLAYQWHIDSAPAGSTAVLSSTLAPMPSFLPNVAGTYTISLVVQDGHCASAPSYVHVASVNAPPVANAGANQTVPKTTVVTLDGSASHDPDGDPITYAWAIVSKPGGSAAALSSATAAKPTFTADLAGVYVVALVVSDGQLTSLTATVTVTAIDVPPVANAGPAQYANVGGSATLNGTASYDPDGDPITYAWTIQSAPAGSAAALTNATSATAGLTPDLEGTYTIQLTVSDGAGSTSATVTVTVYRKIAQLAYRPVDAEYSRSLDRMVMVSASPSNALHVYDPVTGTDQSVALNVAPECVSVSPDGKFAAVGHNAWISYVDLTTATLVHTWPVTADVGDIVIGDPMTVSGKTTRFAYAFPRVDQWVTLHTVDLSTGAETLAGTIRAGTKAKLQFGSPTMFGTTNGLSPPSIEEYLIGANGTATVSSTSAWNAGGIDLWVSDDGVQILTASASRYRTVDLSYGGSLPDASCLLYANAPAAPSAAAGKLLVVPNSSCYVYPSNPANDDTILRVYDASFLTLQSTTALPKFGLGSAAYAAHGRFAFFNNAGARQFALVQADPTSALLYDYGVVAY